MNIERIVVGPLLTNCYIIHDEGECIIVDPGGDADLIIGFIEQNSLKPKLILATHCHFDHVMAVGELKSRYGIPFHINRKDLEILGKMKETARSFLGIEASDPPEPDGFFSEGDEFQVGNSKIKVIETPGHTEGSSSFIVGENILTGDFIFAGSIGRMDFGGSREDMVTSLSRLISFSENYTLHPGHGEITTLEQEKRENPFLKDFDLI